MQALWCCVFKGVACADDEAETPLQRMKEAQTQEDEEEDFAAQQTLSPKPEALNPKP